jgi:hypothetical protein
MAARAGGKAAGNHPSKRGARHAQDSGDGAAAIGSARLNPIILIEIGRRRRGTAPHFRQGQPLRLLATVATVGVVGLIGAGPCIPIEMSQPVLRNQFHPRTAGRSKTGKPEPGTPTLRAGVSPLGWIEDAIGWPSLVAPRADVVVGAMARPALRPVRKAAKPLQDQCRKREAASPHAKPTSDRRSRRTAHSPASAVPRHEPEDLGCGHWPVFSNDPEVRKRLL